MVATAMKARLRTDLRYALKEKDGPRAAVLRSLVAALDSAEAPAIAAGRHRTRTSEAARRRWSDWFSTTPTSDASSQRRSRRARTPPFNSSAWVRLTALSPCGIEAMLVRQYLG